MKYGKLVQIQKKAHKYSMVAGIAIGVLVVLMFFCVFCLWQEMVTPTLLYIIFPVAIVGVTVNLVFTRFHGKQIRCAEDYFAIRIMEVLNEQGIETGKFELIQETEFCYRVGFHNQTIDYEKLQDIIDQEVSDMNKIMKFNKRVKLI